MLFATVAYWRELRWIHIGAMFLYLVNYDAAAPWMVGHLTPQKPWHYCLLHLFASSSSDGTLPLRRRLIGFRFSYSSPATQFYSGLLRIALTLVIAHLSWSFF